MDIYTPIKEHLNTCNGKRLQEIANESGVPFATLTKIKSGETKNPGVLTMQKIWPVIPEGQTN